MYGNTKRISSILLLFSTIVLIGRETKDPHGRAALHYVAMEVYLIKDRYKWMSDHTSLYPSRTDMEHVHIRDKQENYMKAVTLLRAKADPNGQDCEGNTPLYYAAINKNKPLVTLLLKYGADPLIENQYGISAQMAEQLITGYCHIHFTADR